MERTKCVIWMGWKNYCGDVNDKRILAIFYYPERAKQYLNFCIENEKDTSVVYGIEFRNNLK